MAYELENIVREWMDHLILNQIGKLDGIGVAIIKKLLGRDTEVFTDIEQTL